MCCCTTISPRSLICLSMNILLLPRDVGQAHWKHESPITCSLHYVSRPGALIPAHWSASEPQERRHLCLRDAGEVPSTFGRLFLVLFQPFSRSLLIPIFPAVLDLSFSVSPVLFPPSFPSEPQLKTQSSTQLGMPNNQGRLELQEESACTFCAPLPSAAAYCQSGDPTCGAAQ